MNIWLANKRIFLIVFLLIVLITAADAAGKPFVLVIDAGHGGKDVGAKGIFSYEKNINLSVALAFGRYVENNCQDVNVVYTRKKDVFVPLHERANIANKNKADAFISIHTNALPKGRIARGIETYTMGIRRSDEKLSAAQRENEVIMYESDYQQRYEGFDPNSPESAIMFEFMHDENMAKSVELAKYVQSSMCQMTGRPNKGVKQDVFLVLRETSMPACLIELGFISTADEERLLNDRAHIDLLARSIYKAFVRYKNGNMVEVTPMPMPVQREENNDKTQAKKPVNDEKKTAVQAQKSDSQSANTALKNAGSAGNTLNESPRPLFKVQVLAVDRVLKAGSAQLKGLKDVDYYKEGGLVKYTYGATTDYNEAVRLRKSIADKFPQAFIVAFKNGEKINTAEAIKEFRKKGK